MTVKYMYIFFICLCLFTFLVCPNNSLLAQSSAEYSLEDALMDAVNQAFTDVGLSSKIAILHIQTTNNDMTVFIQEELNHILVRRKYTVVDRVDLDRVRQEQSFQYSHEVDDNTAVSLGRFVGADLVVTGGITGTGSLRRLRLKVLDTQTAIIKATASVPYTDIERQQTSTTTIPIVRNITISPATASVLTGQTQQYSAVVSGYNNPSQSVRWTVTGGGFGTSITTSGLLTISNSETATSLTVRATSTVDSSKSGTATVSVTPAPATVSNITISPSKTSVRKGQSRQFKAVVNGNNNPSQSVTWTVTGGGAGTHISSAGLLTIGDRETATSLTVKATSTTDPSKSMTATITPTLPPNVSFVIFGGGSSTWFSETKPIEFDSAYGYNAGIALDIQAYQSPVVWEFGSRLISKGVSYSELYSGADATWMHSFDYVDIFAKVKWDISLGKSNAILPYAGYSAGILSSATETFTYEGFKRDLEISEYCNGIAHAFLLGVDYLFNDTFLIGFEYGIGMSDIYKKVEVMLIRDADVVMPPTPSYDLKYSMNTISVYIGYQF